MRGSMPKILLVEGNAHLRTFLTRVLHECGCEVEAAGNYDEGLRQAQVNHFSFCLTDESLPDGSGSDLCRKIHTLDAEVPVVVCYSHDGQRNAAMEAGALATVKIGDFMTCQLKQVMNHLLGFGL